MKRRDLFKGGLGAGALLGVAGATVPAATAQSARPLRLAVLEEAVRDGAVPDGANAHRTALDEATALARRLSAATAGALSLDVEPATDRDAAALLDRVAAGDVEMAMIDLSRLTGRDMTFGMFDAMPFGFSASELEAWIMASDGRDALDRLGDAHGVALSLVADRGVSPMWSRAPLTDAATLGGLRIGARGLGLRALQAAGAGNVADLHAATTTWGDLDAIDGVGAAEMQARDLIGTYPYMTRVNPNTPSALTALVVHPSVTGGLDEAARTLFDRARSATFALSQAAAYHANAETLRSSGAAITPYDLSEDIWGALRIGAQQVMADIFESGSRSAAISDAYIFFMSDVARWSDIGEAAFYTGRKRLAVL